MTNAELYKEIKELRGDMKKLHQDFYIFKGKAYGFIALLSIVINATIAFVIKTQGN